MATTHLQHYTRADVALLLAYSHNYDWGGVLFPASDGKYIIKEIKAYSPSPTSMHANTSGGRLSTKMLQKNRLPLLTHILSCTQPPAEMITTRLQHYARPDGALLPSYSHNYDWGGGLFPLPPFTSHTLSCTPTPGEMITHKPATLRSFLMMSGRAAG